MKILKQLLNDAVNNQLNREKVSQLGTLSSSNALLFDGENFESEDADHCPRVALLRRQGDVQEDRDLAAYLSNTHGRLFETQIKTILSSINNLCWFAEEEATVEIEAGGHLILTSRPDFVMQYNNKINVLEFKTVQSNSTAYQIFIKEKPKLNAAIQLTINLFGHGAVEGNIVYAVNNWFGGFAGKTRWKVTPSLKIFDCELTNGNFYCNDKMSIVTVDKLMAGALEFIRLIKTNTVPPRPNWLDINGEPASYNGCTYCPFKTVCDRYDQQNLVELDNFMNDCREELTNDKNRIS